MIKTKDIAAQDLEVSSQIFLFAMILQRKKKEYYWIYKKKWMQLGTHLFGHVINMIFTNSNKWQRSKYGPFVSDFNFCGMKNCSVTIHQNHGGRKIEQARR